MDPQIILEEWSPVCNIQAFVEKSDNAYYFYLWVNPESDETEIRSCWICNRIEAPKTVDYSAMENGEAPCMPVNYVKHNISGIELNSDKLHIQWLDEGDGAVLLEADKILAYIPEFSGYNGFHGYSIYAKGTGSFAWELEQAYERCEFLVQKSKKSWDYFEGDFWEDVQKNHIKSLNDFWGNYEKYYAIDGNSFPPKALLVGRKNNVLYAITAGVSIIPMPNVEIEYHEQYGDYRRIELGFACTEKHKELMKMMLGVVSGLSNMPWEALTYLGHGHTVPFSNIKGYEYILLLSDRRLAKEESIKYEPFMGEPINLLWIKPITTKEYNFICEKGVDLYLSNKENDNVYVFGDGEY